MTLEDLTAIINTGNLSMLKSTLEVSKYAYLVSDALGIANHLRTNLQPELQALKEYNPKHHNIFDQHLRKDKTISSDAGAREGVSVPVARIPIPEQKKIVLLAASFLGSPSLACTPDPGIQTDLFSVINEIWEENKLDYKFKNIAKRTMSERECAELWYTEPAEPDFWMGTPMEGTQYKLRMRILCPSVGDTLYPIYDNYGDMIAFGRYYELEIQDFGLGSVSQKVSHFDIYTKDRFYFATRVIGQEWEFNYDPKTIIQNQDGTKTTLKGIPNLIGKIPVVYYFQPYTEWHDVQEMIERLETKISNHADSNDYFDSPIVKAKGKVEGFAEKGEQGKVLTMNEGADVQYLTYDNLPESMKMETENLIKFIHTYTHTPNISFDNIKGLGTFTGIALKMFFMDAHLKASDKEEIFGEGVQRRVNYLKASIAVLNPKLKAALRLAIKPKFEYFLPKNEAEEIDNIIKCVNAGIMSIETAVRLCPLIEDYISELDLITKEADVKATKALALMQAAPPQIPPKI